MTSMTRWFRSSLLVLSITAASIVPLSVAEAALSANLKLKGQKQGDIKGSVTQKGREGSIQVISFNHEVVSPRDAASGLPTGKRQHKPFVITKRIDKSSPLLQSLLANNENIPEWKLDVYLPTPKGIEALAYTVRLVNANVVSIRTNTDDEGNPQEVVSFTYQKIEWTWTDGGITAMDDWESPNA